mmetsp:Transcript_1808/g.2579  ORF Transcript_1808/g.2579 Transcript_1808/m.2579 type:complete len:589 (+) Transcript_1808:93-1859(+)
MQRVGASYSAFAARHGILRSQIHICLKPRISVAFHSRSRIFNTFTKRSLRACRDKPRESSISRASLAFASAVSTASLFRILSDSYVCCDSLPALDMQQKIEVKDNNELQGNLLKLLLVGTFDRCRVVLRLLEWGLCFLPAIITFPIYYIIPKSVSDGEWWRTLFVLGLEWGGPMFVKLGQWASTRSDLFSPSMRSSFARLQGNCRPDSLESIQRTVLEDLGIQHLSDTFEEFSTDPLGAGVIGQVHKAKLKSNGKTVAVKIRRFHIADQLYRDLELLKAVVNVATMLFPKSLEPFSMKDVTWQFYTFMLRQLDLNEEARNLRHFAKNFGVNPSLKVEFPEVYFVSKNGGVLIETYCEGVVLSDLLDMDRKNKSNVLCNKEFRKELADTGLKAFLKMVLVDNFCHSDLHPGNILVEFNNLTPDRTFESARINLENITLVDVGLVTRLSERDQTNFVDLFAAVAKGDGKLAGELIIERAPYNANEKLSMESKRDFIEGVRTIVEKVKVENFVLQKVHIGKVLQDVLNLVYEHKVPLDPSFGTLVLSIVIAEGILRQLDPDLDIFRTSVPFLLKANPEYKKTVIKSILRRD